MVSRSDKQLEIETVRKENLSSIIGRLYERFIMIRGEPREVALGFALGIFVGMTPTVGVQTPIAIFIAALFKWGKLSAAIGVWISNPLTVPLIYSVTYIIGAKLLSLDPVFNMPLSPTWSTLKVMIQKAPQAFGAMTAGGALLGIPLAIISYYLSYAAVDKYQKDVKEKLVRQKARLAGTKEKVKKKIEERKIHKAEAKSQKSEDKDLKSEVGKRKAER
ncbi:hypothetical protein D1BOALGB6SA_7681 [Olavius sp. associated proteobacterium Delta 1]|nr:hypothetical protein D1BOALGB6SA_7681 [Olavius sp. associated proteobacterium Delta 1]